MSIEFILQRFFELLVRFLFRPWQQHPSHMKDTLREEL